MQVVLLEEGEEELVQVWKELRIMRRGHMACLVHEEHDVHGARLREQRIVWIRPLRQRVHHLRLHMLVEHPGVRVRRVRGECRRACIYKQNQR